MVEMYDSVYVSSANLSSRHDLPTPESPIKRSCEVSTGTETARAP